MFVNEKNITKILCMIFSKFLKWWKKIPELELLIFPCFLRISFIKNKKAFYFIPKEENSQITEIKLAYKEKKKITLKKLAKAHDIEAIESL